MDTLGVKMNETQANYSPSCNMTVNVDALKFTVWKKYDFIYYFLTFVPQLTSIPGANARHPVIFFFYLIVKKELTFIC